MTYWGSSNFGGSVECFFCSTFHLKPSILIQINRKLH